MGRHGNRKYPRIVTPSFQVPEGSRMATKGYEWLRKKKMEEDKWQVRRGRNLHRAPASTPRPAVTYFFPLSPLSF